MSRIMKKLIIYLITIFIFTDIFSVYHKVGELEFSEGWIEKIHISGNIAYSVNGFFGESQIIDISEPNNPQVLSSFEIPHEAHDIVVIDTLAYIAACTAGLMIFNVADPEIPVLFGSIDTPGYAMGLDISNDFAYITLAGNGFQVIDVQDPENPVLLGSCDTPAFAFKVTVRDSLAYVSDLSSGLQIINVADPLDPFIISGYDTQSKVYNAKIIDTIAYLADWINGLTILDISDPYDPQFISNYNTSGKVTDIYISGTNAYLADGRYGLHTVDISDLGSPFFVGFYDSPGITNSVVIDGDLAYLAEQDLQVIDISDPEDQILIGHLASTESLEKMVISDNILFSTKDLNIIDLDNPYDPFLISSLGIPGPSNIAISGNVVYSVYYSDFLVIDVNDLENPDILTNFETPGSSNDIQISDNIAYIADGNSGLSVIDIGQPQNPSLLGTCDTPGYADCIALQGNYAFIGDQEMGLQIIDIIDLENPVLLNNYEGAVYRVIVSGSNIFLQKSTGEIRIVDIGDPENPYLVSTIQSPNDHSFLKSDLLIHEDMLIFADNNWNEIFFYDISNPSYPEFISSYRWNRIILDMKIYEQYLVTTNNDYGLSILDLEDITFLNDENIISLDNQLSNFPNPFRASTTISFNVTQTSGFVTLNIYNIKGQKVKTFDCLECSDAFTAASTRLKHSITWDGKNESGKPVSSGIYFINLRSGNTYLIKKAILMR